MKYDKWSINYYHKFHELYNDTNFISLNSCNSSICVIRDEVNWCENEHCNFLTGHYWHSIAWFKPTDIYDTISTSSCQGQKFPTLVAELATILTVVWSRIPEVLGLRLPKISHGEFVRSEYKFPTFVAELATILTIPRSTEFPKFCNFGYGNSLMGNF